MANVTITTNANLDDRVFDPLNSGETITINDGAILTINSDVVDASSSFAPQNVTLGSITINDGKVIIDGTKTREIPFHNMVGATWGASPVYWSVTSSINGTSGSLIGLFFNTGSVSLGVAKFRSLSGPIQENEGMRFNSASYQFQATASSGDSGSWLMICLRESATITTTRQASFIVTGSWYELGTGSNQPNQFIRGAIAKFLSIASTNTGSIGGHLSTQSYCPLQPSYPAIWVERTPNSGQYDIWLNPGSGSQFHSGSVLEGIDTRGQFFLHPNLNGWLTASFKRNVDPVKGNTILQGSRIRVPNVHIFGSAAGKPTSSFNATITTWPDFTTTAAGTIDIRNTSCGAFYYSLGQAFSINIQDSGIHGSVLATEIGDVTYIENVGIGQTTAVAGVGFNFTANYGQTILKDSKACSTVVANSTVPCLQVISSKNVLITGSSLVGIGRTGTAGAHININNSSQVTMSRCDIIGAKAWIQFYCNDIYIHEPFFSTISGSTDIVASVGIDAINSSNLKFDGIRWVKGTYQGGPSMPYGGLFSITSCQNVDFRNMGTDSDRVHLGRGDSRPITYAAFPFLLTNFNLGVKISRCHFTGSRSGYISTNNSNDTVLIQNFSTDNDDQVQLYSRNQISRGMRVGTGILGQAQGIAVGSGLAAVYGTHFYDVFLGLENNSGSVGIVSTEQTTNPYSTGSYIVSGSSTITGSPQFNSNGGVLLRESGSYVIWTHPYYVKGHEGFVSSSVKSSGTNIASWIVDYQIDPATGVFSDWKRATSNNLAGETIDSNLGFKLKVKVTATGSNPNTQLTALCFDTRTSLPSIQTSSLYPIDSILANLTLTGLITGSEVRVYESESSIELSGVEESGTTFTYPYLWEGTDKTVSIVIVNVQYEYIRYDNITLGSTGLSIPIQQRFDRNYKT